MMSTVVLILQVNLADDTCALLFEFILSANICIYSDTSDGCIGLGSEWHVTNNLAGRAL